ncbi:MAG: AIR synthase family protein [Candidatus Bathyarchaeia archaeon]
MREPTVITLVNVFRKFIEIHLRDQMKCRLPVGKVPVSSLRKIVFRNLGIPDSRLLVGPGIGEDAAVVKTGGRLIILSTDPVTGALKNLGWLSVHINANDVATRGARPKWYLCSIMLPENSSEDTLRGIMRQVHRACLSLRVAVAGGHSEVTSVINRPVIVGFMVGEAEHGRYFSSSGAEAGDSLIVTKSSGIEGTAIIATDFAELLKEHLDSATIRRAQLLYRRISVVEDALTALDAGGVRAMHDPTEGGVLCGVWEFAEASGLGVKIFGEDIPILNETEAVSKALGLNPLRMMSSGSLLIAARPSSSERIISRLSTKGIEATLIGEFTDIKKGRKIVYRDGSSADLKPPFPDEVYTLFKRLEGE